MTPIVHDHESARRELHWALLTRVLTDEEMQRVKEWGYQLCVGKGQSYFQPQKVMEFQNALLIQYQIRDIANRGVVIFRKAEEKA